MGSDIESGNNRATLSPKAERELTNELNDLRERERVLSDPEGGEAVPDAGDSAESLRRADEKARVAARIAEIERLVSPNAAGAGDPPADVERLTGASVTIRTEDGSSQSFRVVMSAEARVADEGDQVVSVHSPLGQSLKDAREGDTIHYTTAIGRRRATVERLELM